MLSSQLLRDQQCRAPGRVVAGWHQVYHPLGSNRRRDNQLAWNVCPARAAVRNSICRPAAGYAALLCQARIPVPNAGRSSAA